MGLGFFVFLGFFVGGASVGDAVGTAVGGAVSGAATRAGGVLELVAGGRPDAQAATNIPIAMVRTRDRRVTCPR